MGGQASYKRRIEESRSCTNLAKASETLQSSSQCRRVLPYGADRKASDMANDCLPVDLPTFFAAPPPGSIRFMLHRRSRLNEGEKAGRRLGFCQLLPCLLLASDIRYLCTHDRQQVVMWQWLEVGQR
jgi:hypothetical protein